MWVYKQQIKTKMFFQKNLSSQTELTQLPDGLIFNHVVNLLDFKWKINVVRT